MTIEARNAKTETQQCSDPGDMFFGAVVQMHSSVVFNPYSAVEVPSGKTSRTREIERNSFKVRHSTYNKEPSNL